MSPVSNGKQDGLFKRRLEIRVGGRDMLQQRREEDVPRYLLGKVNVRRYFTGVLAGWSDHKRY